MPGFHYNNPLAYAGSIPGFNVRQQYAWQGTETENASAQPHCHASAPAPSQRQIAPLPAPKQRKSGTKKGVNPVPQAGSSTSNPSQIHTGPIAVPNVQQNTANAASSSKKRASGTKAKASKRKAAEVESASPTVARQEKKGKVAHASTTSWPAPHTIVPSMGPPLRPASLPQAAPLPQAAQAHRAALPQAAPPSVVRQAFHPSSVRSSLPQGNQPPYSAFYPPGNASASGPQSHPAQAHPRPRPRPVAASRDAPAPATGMQRRLPPPVTPTGTPGGLQCFPPLIPRAQAANNAFSRDASVAPHGAPQGTPAGQAGPSFPVGMWREILFSALSNMTDVVHGRYWTLLAGHIMTQMARLPEDHPEKPDFNALVRSCSQPFPDVAQTNMAGPSQPRQYVPQQQAGPVMVPRAGYTAAYGAGPAHPIGREGRLEEMDRVYHIDGAGRGGASGSGPYGDPRLGTAEHPIVLDEEEYSIEDLYADA